MMMLICIDFSEELCVYYELALASFRHVHPDQYSEKDKPVSQRNENYRGMITSPDLIQSIQQEERNDEDALTYTA